MGLFRRQRSAADPSGSAATRDGRTARLDGDSTAPGGATSAEPGPRAWESLPPLSATVGLPPSTFKIGAAVKEDLVALASPRLSTGMGHLVGDDGPSGVVSGLVDLAVQRHADVVGDGRTRARDAGLMSATRHSAGVDLPVARVRAGDRADEVAGHGYGGGDGGEWCGLPVVREMVAARESFMSPVPPVQAPDVDGPLRHLPTVEAVSVEVQRDDNDETDAESPNATRDVSGSSDSATIAIAGRVTRGDRGDQDPAQLIDDDGRVGAEAAGDPASKAGGDGLDPIIDKLEPGGLRPPSAMPAPGAGSSDGGGAAPATGGAAVQRRADKTLDVATATHGAPRFPAGLEELPIRQRPRRERTASMSPGGPGATTDPQRTVARAPAVDRSVPAIDHESGGSSGTESVPATAPSPRGSAPEPFTTAVDQRSADVDTAPDPAHAAQRAEPAVADDSIDVAPPASALVAEPGGESGTAGHDPALPLDVVRPTLGADPWTPDVEANAGSVLGPDDGAPGSGAVGAITSTGSSGHLAWPVAAPPFGRSVQRQVSGGAGVGLPASASIAARPGVPTGTAPPSRGRTGGAPGRSAMALAANGGGSVLPIVGQRTSVSTFTVSGPVNPDAADVSTAEATRPGVAGGRAPSPASAVAWGWVDAPMATLQVPDPLALSSPASRLVAPWISTIPWAPASPGLGPAGSGAPTLQREPDPASARDPEVTAPEGARSRATAFGVATVPESAPMNEVTFPAATPPTPSSAGEAATSAAAPAASGDLDDLAHKLYDRIRWRLRAELRLDMERAGLGAGVRR
jgi:hypothetical protein